MCTKLPAKRLLPPCCCPCCFAVHATRQVDVQLPDVMDLTGPAVIAESAAAAAGPAAAAAAAEAAAYAAEQEEQDCTPEQLDQALTDQSAADEQEQLEQEQPPEEARSSWRAALLWSMGVENGQDLLNPTYQEAITGPRLRTVAAPAAGVDPRTLAAQFLAQQQQQQALQQQQQQQALQQQQQQLLHQQGLLPVINPLAQIVLQQQQQQLARLQQRNQ
mgnify:CR=1 FL=1